MKAHLALLYCLAVLLVFWLTWKHPTIPTLPANDPAPTGQAYPSGPPIKQETGRVLKSADEAAVAGLAYAYLHHPHYYEYGGVIVRLPNGTFNASAPVSDYHATDVTIDDDNETYEGSFPIVADYHIHPCVVGYVPEVFSPADLKSARSTGLSNYILDSCTGDVHRWRPGDPYDYPTEELDTSGGARAARGTVVGHIQVDGMKIVL